MPLRGTSLLTLTTSRQSTASPNRVRAAMRSPAWRGRKRSTSTPGGTSVHGGSRPPAARAASMAG